MASPQPVTTSGLLTADTAVLARPGRLKHVMLIADGTNAATVIVYDNATAASGNVLAKLSIAATGTHQFVQFDAAGVECNAGIYADVTGTGAAFVIGFSPA